VRKNIFEIFRKIKTMRYKRRSATQLDRSRPPCQRPSKPTSAIQCLPGTVQQLLRYPTLYVILPLSVRHSLTSLVESPRPRQTAIELLPPITESRLECRLQSQATNNAYDGVHNSFSSSWCITYYVAVLTTMLRCKIKNSVPS
jgi:hypothetical protein